MPRCPMVSPTAGYEQCTRETGHEGPCAHPFSKHGDLPLYLCHKEVRAVKIKAIRYSPDNRCALLIPCEDDFAPITVECAWIVNHEAQPGGYFVLYQDGYTSYSPAEAFEQGYTKIVRLHS